MTEVEQRLRAEETAELQRRIRANALTDEAASIAARILLERGAAVPAAESEEVAEARVRKALRASNAKAVLVVAWCFAVWAFELYQPERRQLMVLSCAALALSLGWRI